VPAMFDFNETEIFKIEGTLRFKNSRKRVSGKDFTVVTNAVKLCINSVLWIRKMYCFSVNSINRCLGNCVLTSMVFAGVSHFNGARFPLYAFFALFFLGVLNLKNS
jgi:hypothetical protein